MPSYPERPRQARLIGAAIGYGAHDPGCAEGPAHLQSLDLAGRLARRGVPVAWQDILLPPQSQGKRLARVSNEFSLALSRAVLTCRDDGCFPVVLGGDHSCAIGTWNGVARSLDGPLGMLWIDAHMDSHTPDTSHSGRLHGMPLAVLLGQGDGNVRTMLPGQLLPENVALVGVRSYEPEEAALLERLGVRIYGMQEVESRGLATVLREAAARAAAGTAGFGISLDLDAVDPRDAPGVGSPVAGGLRAPALRQALREISVTPQLAALEIVEYNPRLDPTGTTAGLIEDLIGAVLEPRPSLKQAA
jgi:arginase